MTTDIARLTPEREAEIRERTPKRAAALTAWIDKFFPLAENQRAVENAETVLEEDVPALLAELAAVRAERDELAVRARRVAISHEHFIWHDSDPGTEALASQYELINNLSALPSQADLPVNPVENALRLVLALLDQYDENVTPGEIRKALAKFLPRDDKSDNRHRLYIDGKGNAWISVCSDEGTEWVMRVQPEPAVEQDVRDVADETGSLREIGRCW